MSEIFSLGENLRKAILQSAEYALYIRAKNNLEDSPESLKTFDDFMSFYEKFQINENIDFNSEKIISFFYSAFVLDEKIAEYISAGKALCALLRETEENVFAEIYWGI